MGDVAPWYCQSWWTLAKLGGATGVAENQKFPARPNVDYESEPAGGARGEAAETGDCRCDRRPPGPFSSTGEKQRFDEYFGFHVTGHPCLRCKLQSMFYCLIVTNFPSWLVVNFLNK